MQPHENRLNNFLSNGVKETSCHLKHKQARIFKQKYSELHYKTDTSNPGNKAHQTIKWTHAIGNVRTAV